MITASQPKTQTAKSTHSTHEAKVDAELVRRFNDGDESAFLEIMKRYEKKIYATALNLLRNHADAEEITQDTFIRAHRGLHRFRGDSSLATWMHSIAVNLSRNRYWYFFRRRRQDCLSLDHKLNENDEGCFSDLLASEGPHPAQDTAADEFYEIINDSMERLNHRHRKILMMRNSLDYSYDEIAAAMHINVGTVKSRIARAREKLRALIAESYPEFEPDQASDYFISRPSIYGSLTIAHA